MTNSNATVLLIVAVVILFFCPLIYCILSLTIDNDDNDSIQLLLNRDINSV